MPGASREDGEAHLVIRKPVFMEDEGRFQVIGRFDTGAEAREWVEAQAGEFFRPSDYEIVVVER